MCVSMSMYLLYAYVYPSKCPHLYVPMTHPSSVTAGTAGTAGRCFLAPRSLHTSWPCSGRLLRTAGASSETEALRLRGPYLSCAAAGVGSWESSSEPSLTRQVAPARQANCGDNAK